VCLAAHCALLDAEQLILVGIVAPVTAPSWTATRGMAELVAAYRQRYPEVVVDLSFEDRFADLVEEGYDLAIRATTDQPPAGLIARPLRPMPFVIAASEEYLRRCGAPQTPGDLS
jgi:DNA-binding transcriptional LysR family regulator